MPSYDALLSEAIAIANEYSLSSFLTGFDASLINILLANHIDILQDCIDYTSTMLAITRAISAHIGMNVNIDTFITLSTDRIRLYEIFTQWRTQLLDEVMFSHAP